MDFGRLFARNVHPEIAGLARYACDLAGDENLPHRSRFDPLRISSIIDYVFLIDVLVDPDDYHFALFGNRIAVLYGANLGGMRLSEIDDPVLRQSLRRTYDRVVRTNLPLYMRGRYVWPEKSIAIERLLIPMAADDGRMNTICGISIPEAGPQNLETCVGVGPAQLVGDDELMLAAG
jgi:hypothetical protein